MKNKNTVFLCESAVMIALSCVLSLVKIITLPQLGSITLVSMLPVMLISIKHGIKKGLPVALVYALCQLMFDIGAPNQLSVGTYVGSIIFDYIIAFSALGLAGIFGNKKTSSIASGVTLAVSVRFVSHIISGWILFGYCAWEGWNPLLYSVCYNASYILPELVLTLIVVIIMTNNKTLSRLIRV